MQCPGPVIPTLEEFRMFFLYIGYDIISEKGCCGAEQQQQQQAYKKFVNNNKEVSCSLSLSLPTTTTSARRMSSEIYSTFDLMMI
jgi:hypothetical protein